MNVKIAETISKNNNPSVEQWYKSKVKELAHFFANKAKNQAIYTDNYIVIEQKELEVVAK